MLPTFLTGGKWDFQVAILQLATDNFEPWLIWISGGQIALTVHITEHLKIKVYGDTSRGNKCIFIFGLHSKWGGLLKEFAP